MTATPLPYFFDEAELASKGKQPGERETALNFSIDDLNWLNTVYKATHEARNTDAKPMQVDRLLLTVTGKTDIPLAGAFAMSRPDDGEVILYTPWKGLIKFADMEEVKSTLKEWLGQDTGKRELLRFLSIEQRSALPDATTPDISTQQIDGAVFEDQELTLERNQTQNIKTMLGELLQFPTWQSMLDETLNNALRKPFPKLDQRHTRLKSLINTVSAFDNSDYQHTISSLSLSDALLLYYLTNQWPPGDSRSFSHPGHGVGSDKDNQAWESAIKEIAQSFTPHLQSLLETFWNTSMRNEQSRSEFFTDSLCDTFHLKLLLQRQQGTLTTQEYLRLMNVSLQPATDDSLRIEKVRVTARFKHYAELASTLMIGSSDTLGFLYTQSRGIEATSDLPAVRKIVLEMTKSEGHEDTLLNYMSLDERGTFLSMEQDERVIIGKPIIGAVFEQLMADILGKQRENLSHALSRYRESEGTQDPHALLDKALDVRGLIDDRLLAADAAGRWTTHLDQRWSAQPATVRGESAKEQLNRLSSVEQALDQLRENHPAIPATTRTIAEAQSIVKSSIENLQSDFTRVLSTALRSELQLRAVTHTLGTTEQAIIKTVLDTPVRLQRAALNGFFPDVFSLALKAGDATDPVKLASCLLMTERGGLDPVNSGTAILWTPALGFEAFKTLTTLLTELERRLKDDAQRTIFLENLERNERLPGRAYTMAPLQRIDGHFLDHVQKHSVQLDQASLTKALATNLPPTTKASLLKLVALRQPMTGLQRATDIAQSLTTQQKLPAWLAKASIKDQILHGELLQQYLNNVTDDQDYLTGIRSLPRTAHHELEKQLKADSFEFDPDKIQIQINERSRSAASTSTLTGFALTHFKDLDQADFEVVSLDSKTIPKGMNQSYIKDLIRNLKLGEHQQKILKEAFADTQPKAAERKKRFYAQLPWQLMYYAHTEKLKERLSETGFDLIKQVMDMPDAIARAAVDGAHAIMRPLELNGIKGKQTIKVPGVYLIGSSADSVAAQILIAPHSPSHGMKEYENETQLLTDLKTRGGLLDWVLMNLPQSERTLLENQMANTGNRVARATPTNTDTTEVTLASNPISGNLFKRLFNDNVGLLSRLLGCQSDDNNQSEWASIKHVLGEDLHEAFTFLTGKLSYPVTVWRSYRDIKQSAEDLQTHKWGAAVQEFISGIAQLAMLRQSLEAPATPSSAPSAPAPETPDGRFKWQSIDITAPERTDLKRHESVDVNLGSLTLDSTLGLYTDPSTKKQYGPVEGKVYPVLKKGTRWRIADTKTRGPYISQNTSKQWVLGRETPRPRFSLTRRFATALSVSAGMNVEASGMPEIRLLFPVKARLIDEALDTATSYAWNAVRNLQLLKVSGGPVTPVHQLIMDFLGVSTVLPAHVDKVEKVVGDIFAALLDPSLRQPKSKRFVVGRVLEQRESTFGLTVAQDTKRRIYLAEKFFVPNYDHYRNYLSDAAFPISPHARAATLIHELSHIVCETEDISYLDSGRPFADLIETSSPRAIALKKTLTDIQGSALSNKTPLPELFAIYDDHAGVWEDFGSTSYENTKGLKKLILKLTGKKTLIDARQTFKTDSLVRLAVQLSNADTVAWLISHLGRQLHTSTP